MHHIKAHNKQIVFQALDHLENSAGEGGKLTFRPKKKLVESSFLVRGAATRHRQLQGLRVCLLLAAREILRPVSLEHRKSAGTENHLYLQAPRIKQGIKQGDFSVFS